MDTTKVRSWLLDVLDPGRDRRTMMSFEPSGDMSFDAHRFLSSDKVRAELDRIGEMQKKLQRQETDKNQRK
jgi:hypothetical protein